MSTIQPTLEAFCSPSSLILLLSYQDMSRQVRDLVAEKNDAVLALSHWQVRLWSVEGSVGAHHNGVLVAGPCGWPRS